MADFRDFAQLESAGVLTAAAGKDRLVLPFNGEFVNAVAAVGVAPATAAIVADLLLNGVSIYSVGAVTAVAATDRLTVPTPHGLVVGDTVQLGTVTSIVGLTAATVYYVKSVPTTNSVTLAATLGGALIDITTGGTAISLTPSTARPSIAIAAFNTVASVRPFVTKFVAGDVLSLDIVQVGTTPAGSDLTVSIQYVAV